MQLDQQGHTDDQDGHRNEEMNVGHNCLGDFHKAHFILHISFPDSGKSIYGLISNLSNSGKFPQESNGTEAWSRFRYIVRPMTDVFTIFLPSFTALSHVFTFIGVCFWTDLEDFAELIGARR